MAVTFIIGRAGTGKTRRCIDAIVEAVTADPLGPPIFWIVPRQATFAAERELTCNTRLGGYFRARVVSFEQLGREILAECGGSSIPEITPLGRQMLIGNLLRKHSADLKYFGGVARQPGLAAQLDRTFAEFETAGKDPGELDNLLRAATASDAVSEDALLNKLHDVQLIYRNYAAHLGQDRFDQFRRLNEVLKCISTARLIQKATVYCDDFREFTEYERQVLAALGKSCRSVEITFTIDPTSPVLADRNLLPDEHSLFHPIESTYRRLRFTLNEERVPVDDPPVLLGEVYRFQSPPLQRLERYAFKPRSAVDLSSAAAIELTDTPTRPAEVDAAARKILALTREGYRFRDIALLARDISAYEDAIALSFPEHGIPWFIDRRRSMSHHALLRFLRAAMTIARGNWPHEAMMDLLKTGLCGLDVDTIDRLENYALHHRIRGDAWAGSEPWSYHDAGVLRETTTTVTPEFDVARRSIVEPLRSFIAVFAGTPKVTDAARAIFELMDQFHVRQHLSTWIAAAETAKDLPQATEHQQVWAEIVELFEELVALLGDEAVTVDGFANILDAGLESFTLALTPPALDEVLVGEIKRTRTPNVKALLVLGLNDGVFPQVARDESVLSDADRQFFGRRALELASSSSRRFLDEEFLAYFAFTRPSHLLYVSHARSDAGGKPLAPSQYFVRLGRMFPNATRVHVPRDSTSDPQWIATPRQLIYALGSWVRRSKDASATDPQSPWPALYQRFIEMSADPRYRGWQALAYSNEASLSPDVVAKLYTLPLQTTAAELETFAACPFRHFLRDTLDLQPRDDGDVSALDLGNVYHQVLERIVGSMLKTKRPWADLKPAERDRLIQSAATQISHDLRGEVFLASARNRYLLDRVQRTLGQVVDTQRTGASRGKMKPAGVRVRFGPNESVPPLSITTPGGREILLSGKIDRVDLHAGHAVVIDYRMGSRTLPLAEVYHGLQLQLLTSLLVLEAHGEAIAGEKLTPAAALYVKTLRQIEEVKHPTEAKSLDDEIRHLETKPRGVVVESAVPVIDAMLQSGSSDVIQCRIVASGGYGSKGQSDLASPEEFRALLDYVRRRIGQLADEMLAGSVAIKPYQMGTKSPCQTCGYQTVCRFQSSEKYNHLESIKREEMLRIIVQGDDADA